MIVLLLLMIIGLGFTIPIAHAEQIIFNSTENIPMFFDSEAGKWKEVTTFYNLVPHDNASMLIVK